MKKITWNQVKGLTWFIIVYALVRLALAFPGLETQGKEMFIVSLSAMVLAWLAYTDLRSNQAFMGLSISIAVTAGLVYLTWGDFGQIEAFWSLVIIGGAAFLSAIGVLIYRLKLGKEWLAPLLLHLIGTIAIFFLMELLVVPFLLPLLS